MERGARGEQKGWGTKRERTPDPAATSSRTRASALSARAPGGMRGMQPGLRPEVAQAGFGDRDGAVGRAVTARAATGEASTSIAPAAGAKRAAPLTVHPPERRVRQVVPMAAGSTSQQKEAAASAGAQPAASEHTCSSTPHATGGSPQQQTCQSGPSGLAQNQHAVASDVASSRHVSAATSACAPCTIAAPRLPRKLLSASFPFRPALALAASTYQRDIVSFADVLQSRQERWPPDAPKPPITMHLDEVAGPSRAYLLNRVSRMCSSARRGCAVTDLRLVADDHVGPAPHEPVQEKLLQGLGFPQHLAKQLQWGLALGVAVPRLTCLTLGTPAGSCLTLSPELLCGLKVCGGLTQLRLGAGVLLSGVLSLGDCESEEQRAQLMALIQEALPAVVHLACNLPQHSGLLEALVGQLQVLEQLSGEVDTSVLRRGKQLRSITGVDQLDEGLMLVLTQLPALQRVKASELEFAESSTGEVAAAAAAAVGPRAQGWELAVGDAVLQDVIQLSRPEVGGPAVLSVDRLQYDVYAAHSGGPLVSAAAVTRLLERTQVQWGGKLSLSLAAPQELHFLVAALKQLRGLSAALQPAADCPTLDVAFGEGICSLPQQLFSELRILAGPGSQHTQRKMCLEFDEAVAGTPVGVWGVEGWAIEVKVLSWCGPLPLLPAESASDEESSSGEEESEDAEDAGTSVAAGAGGDLAMQDASTPSPSPPLVLLAAGNQPDVTPDAVTAAPPPPKPVGRSSVLTKRKQR